MVESDHPQYLKSYREKGFLSSYYLPSGLTELDDDSLETVIQKIKMNMDMYETDYISAYYADYKILKKQFPDKKKLIWFNIYGSLNKFTARILLFEIVLDKNVEVLLIPFHSTNGNK